MMPRDKELWVVIVLTLLIYLVNEGVWKNLWGCYRFVVSVIWWERHRWVEYEAWVVATSIDYTRCQMIFGRVTSNHCITSLACVRHKLEEIPLLRNRWYLLYRNGWLARKALAWILVKCWNHVVHTIASSDLGRDRVGLIRRPLMRWYLSEWKVLEESILAWLWYQLWLSTHVYNRLLAVVSFDTVWLMR